MAYKILNLKNNFTFKVSKYVKRLGKKKNWEKYGSSFFNLFTKHLLIATLFQFLNMKNYLRSYGKARG